MPALFPSDGPVRAILYGEAPGPRGADRSGIPFWGDRSGKLVYRALARCGMAIVPEAAWDAWDGARLAALGLRPVLRGAALSNAYPSCPTEDGHAFRSPRDGELAQPANLARIRGELERGAARCPGALRVVAFGRRAEWVLRRVAAAGVELHALPHPSAQALLSTAPGKGKGLRLADLEAAWLADLEAILRG